MALPPSAMKERSILIREDGQAAQAGEAGRAGTRIVERDTDAPLPEALYPPGGLPLVVDEGGLDRLERYLVPGFDPIPLRTPWA